MASSSDGNRLKSSGGKKEPIAWRESHTLQDWVACLDLGSIRLANSTSHFKGDKLASPTYLRFGLPSLSKASRMLLGSKETGTFGGGNATVMNTL